jgi:hypothetical protein
MNNARYTISYQTVSATHSLRPFVTLEFGTKKAALAAAAERAAYAATQTNLPHIAVRVATPAGNLVRYFTEGHGIG